MRYFWTLLYRECLLSWRARSELLNPLLFFVVVASLFPLATTPDLRVLKIVGPGVIWVSALLAMLLSLQRLFLEDYRDGTLEQLMLRPYPLALIVFAKLLAYWFVFLLPLIIVAPVLAVMFHLTSLAILHLMLSLLLGTLLLIMIGGIIAALTVGLRGGGLLLALLFLPLTVPTLIFGAAATTATSFAPLLWLAAMLVLAVSIAPMAAAFALRVGIAYD